MTDTAQPQELILVRAGAEVSTKSRRTRHRFQQVLCDNIRDALERAGLAHDVRASHTRVWVATHDAERACDALARVFGIGSFSPVEARAEPRLSAIVERGAELFHERVRGRRYAVRAKRIGRHPFSSSQIERELGAALNEGATVDLEHPDITVRVEVDDQGAYLFTDRRAGAGGLPLGVQGRALALISGGFDSAVAAWRIMRRGVAVDYCFCNLAGAAYERTVLQVTKLLTELWDFGQRPQFYVLDFSEAVEQLRERVKPSYVQVVLKRLMYRAATGVAQQANAEVLVTGEAIGQVSSQTLANLISIDPAAGVPVLRPLLGYDKQEIIAEARRIGTAPLSERIKEYCALVPERPVVAGKTGRAADEEAKLDDDLVERLLATCKVIDLRSVTPKDMRVPYLFTEEIPEHAVVIDCQREPMYRAWHVPEARHYSPLDLMEGYRKLDKDQTYVLYCEFGTQTVQIAELMQQDGYDAYAFKGGVSTVQRYVEGRR